MSLPHDNAHTHVTGQSEYVDDRPLHKNELWMDVLFSTQAHAEFSLDTTLLDQDAQVVAYYTGDDFSHNLWGTIFQDQPIVATKKVHFAGEAILLIVAKTREAAAYAKQKVKVHYHKLPAILSIDEARKQQSFIGSERYIKRGEFDSSYENSPLKLQGKVHIKGAEHFYLESQATVVYPLEDGQIEVHSSSQHPTETQHVVSHALGLDSKDVVVQVKRMGGGFGGKESQAAPFAAMCALAAHKLQRPVRLVLTKDDDMVMTGKRHPFENEYQVGFDSEGRILALKVHLFSDGGAYADLSTSIMERAMLHIDNAYFIPHIHVTGQVCKTHYHPHTAFRGFGGPQGVATIEYIIEQIAHATSKDPLDVRKINLYSDDKGRNLTHYQQVFKNNCLKDLFDRLEKTSHYRQRRQEIIRHNQTSQQFLRGLSLTPVKFGISFTTRFLNQGNALVIIYKDGTIQIATGATEMGQGVNARISEIVTSELGLPRHQARVMPTRTDKNANTSPTAASSGTDINGAAALLATRKIKYRLSQLALRLFSLPRERWASKTAGLGTEREIQLEHLDLQTNDPNLHAEWKSGVANYFNIIFSEGYVYHQDNPSQKISFSDLVVEAYLNRISLVDYAFYKIPGIEFNKLTGQGDPFLYFTQGVACSEVQVNRDTGEVKVQRVDILMDLGRPINRDLDIGQVTGGFIQGMGWVTTEHLYYNQDGFLLSHAPSTYKIPNIQDTPRVFNIELHQNEENYANLRGTKAVGEPPLLLCASVWMAIHDALSMTRTYEKSYPNLGLPATNEVVLKNLHPEAYQFYSKL